MNIVRLYPFLMNVIVFRSILTSSNGLINSISEQTQISLDMVKYEFEYNHQKKIEFRHDQI
jgi:hypothetical protein